MTGMAVKWPFSWYGVIGSNNWFRARYELKDLGEIFEGGDRMMLLRF